MIAHGLDEYMNSPEMKAFLNKPIAMALSTIGEELQIELEREDLVWPTGMVGLAMFKAEDGEAGADAENDEAAAPSERVLFVADFGTNFEQANEIWGRVWDSMDRLEGVTLEEREAIGRTLYSIAPPPVDPAERLAEFEKEFGEDWWEDEEGQDVTEEEKIQNLRDWGYLEPEFPSLFVAVDGTTFFVSNREAALEDVFHGLDGEDRDTFAEHDLVEPALAVVGGRGEIYGVAIVPEIDIDALQENIDDTFGMFLPPVGPFVNALGLPSLKAASLSFRAGEAGGDILGETNVGLLMPEGRAGMFNLLEVADDKPKPPPWAGPNVASFTWININYPALIPIVREVVVSVATAMEQPEQIEVFDQFAAAYLQPIAEIVGPATYFAQWPREEGAIEAAPAGEDAEAALGEALLPPTLFAISCSDETVVQNVLAQIPGLQGMIVARDFLGSRIYEPAQGMGGPALGLGKGHVLIGGVQEVEAALRAEPGGETLGDNPGYVRAAGTLPDELALVYYVAAEPYYENMVRTLREGLGSVFKDAEEFGDDSSDNPAAWFDPETVPDAEFFLRYVGDMIGGLEVRDDGLVLQMRQLTPQQ